MANETRSFAVGAINELANVVMNFVTTRYLLDIVSQAQESGQVEGALI